MVMVPLLTTTGISKRYGRTRALDNLDLELEPGCILGLLGPNGSGKSTLLKIVAGLTRPDAGEVRVLGLKPGPAARARLAYLPEVDCLYRDLTVAGTLAYVSTFFADWSPARAVELLEFMDLNPRAVVGTLSRGMRARLKLVLALARDAALFLLDEPLAGIDPRSRARIVEACIRQYKDGQSMIISTHEVLHAEGAFDRVVFLEAGRVKLAGAAEELRRRHNCSLEALFGEVYA
ncbi:MAG: ABC transporter ATP-binding protein [bacterium]|nr:ABC transporter ATP-binding protein [bacterium]